MKIYFADSIRGGREDKALYLEIINLLKNYGQVLTEHIGSASLDSMGETGLTDIQICERDLNWVKEADAIVAEVTTASLGVGYEIGFAEALGKNILCIFRAQEGKRVSAMINGNKNLLVKEYRKLADLKPLFDSFLT